MSKKLTLVLLCYGIILFAGQRKAFVPIEPPEFQQQSKEALFKEFNEKKRSDIEEAYKLAEAYLEKYGNEPDDNTKYVKEWVVAYRAVKAQTPAEAKPPESPSPNVNKPDTTAAANSAKPLDINGTTWQVQGKENGKPWAEVFVFKAGGRFQHERYGADGSSNISAGTWRLLGQNIFATLLGPDGNTSGTARAELNGACLIGTLTVQGRRDLRFMMETDSVPNGCTGRREAERRAQEEQRRQAEKVLAAGKAKAATMPATIKNNAGMEFVLIQPGRFMMGSSSASDYLQHEVTITQPFYIGRYEVTQAQWQTLMGNNPSGFDKCGGNCPVENVSWNDSEGFISRLNSQGGDYTYRLPTEAEWEYAARAGTTGDHAGNLDSMGWYGENQNNRTHPVGTKQANAWGLYDMHGNVWEWCQDWYDANYYKASAAADPQGPANGQHRVLRGGAWWGPASNARSAYRGYGTPDHRVYVYGFRVVAVERTR